LAHPSQCATVVSSDHRFPDLRSVPKQGCGVPLTRPFPVQVKILHKLIHQFLNSPGMEADLFGSDNFDPVADRYGDRDRDPHPASDNNSVSLSSGTMTTQTPGAVCSEGDRFLAELMSSRAEKAARSGSSDYHCQTLGLRSQCGLEAGVSAGLACNQSTSTVH